MNTLDKIIVFVLVAVSAVYLIRLVAKSLRGSKKGCDHCSGGSS